MQKAQTHVLPKERLRDVSRWQGYTIFPLKWASKANQVGSVPLSAPVVTPKSGQRPTEQLSFVETFGRYGVPMLLMLLVSIAWTSWLLALTYAPTWTANYLMNTDTFDDGNFWLLVDTEPWMKALSLAGLGLVALAYVYVLLKMVLWRNSKSSLFSESFASRIESSTSLKQIVECVPRKLRLRRVHIMQLWQDLTGFHGSKRKFWVGVAVKHS